MFSLDAHNLRNDGGIKYEKNRIGNKKVRATISFARKVEMVASQICL